MAAATRNLRATLRRWHIWLGWLIGVPLLFWSLSGLVMVLRPIDEVRGRGILRELPVPTVAGAVVAPTVTEPLAGLTIEARAGGPRWVARLADGGARLADVRSGQWLPAPGVADIRREFAARYTGRSAVVAITRSDRLHSPLELRREVDAWCVTLADGTHVYLDAQSGAPLATRTAYWRFYDWMWGLHIMDLGGRENTHHPVLVAAAAITLAAVLMALVLLPLAQWKRRRRA
jgi:PepSY-associated TM region